MKNASKTINSRELHIFAKRGKTSEEFMEMYGFDTEQKLFDAIREVTSDYKKVIRDIRGNTRKHKNVSIATETNVPSTTEAETIAMEAEAQAMAMEVKTEDAETTVVDCAVPQTELVSFKEEDPMEALHKLQDDERMLSAACIECENQHKECVRVRAQIDQKLQEHKAEFLKILKKVENMHTQMHELEVQHAEITQQMFDTYAEVAEYQELLQIVRQEIEARKVVNIMVYRDHFTFENLEKPAITAERVSEIFEIISQYPESDDLTLRELKTVASLLASLELVGNIKCEIAFDNELAHNVYKKAFTPYKPA